ncbi:MAG: hypothetical protein [Microvirus sp.]|nr:MAG: hypothetical protein [Microvirus sp.]
MQFKHTYNAVPTDGYDPGGELMVERSGYRSTQQMILEFMNAGIALQAYRQENYDYPAGEVVPDDAQGDPTRAPNFDLADASLLQRQTEARLQHQKAQAVTKQRMEQAEAKKEFEAFQASQKTKAPE